MAQAPTRILQWDGPPARPTGLRAMVEGQEFSYGINTVSILVQQYLLQYLINPFSALEGEQILNPVLTIETGKFGHIPL